jgi:hypothetical protein
MSRCPSRRSRGLSISRPTNTPIGGCRTRTAQIKHPRARDGARQKTNARTHRLRLAPTSHGTTTCSAIRRRAHTPVDHISSPPRARRTDLNAPALAMVCARPLRDRGKVRRLNPALRVLGSADKGAPLLPPRVELLATLPAKSSPIWQCCGRAISVRGASRHAERTSVCSTCPRLAVATSLPQVRSLIESAATCRAGGRGGRRSWLRRNGRRDSAGKLEIAPAFHRRCPL